MPPASAGTPRNSLSHMLMTTCTFGNSALRSRAGDVAEIFDQHRARPDAALQGPPGCLWASLRSRLERDQQHHVVVDRPRRPCRCSHPIPVRDLKTLAVLAAAEEAHVAEVLERRDGLDPSASALSRCARSISVVRHLDEIGALEHRRPAARPAPHRRGRRRRGVNRACADELRIEIVVGVLELLEPVEIFVVVDRRQHLADLPELLAPPVVRERATAR